VVFSSDFSKYLCKGADVLMMKDRFDTVPLTGITAIPHKKSFTGIQVIVLQAHIPR